MTRVRRTPSALGQALIVVLALVLGTLVFVYGGRPKTHGWKVGERVEAKLTLVTSDRFDLGCVYPHDLPSGHCSFRAPGEKFRTGPGATLAPYVTVSRKMVLLPDLFDLPEVRRRYEQDPPAHRARKSLKRFSLTCELTIVARPRGVRVRFGRGDPWSAEKQVWAGKIHTCKIEE